MNKGSPGYFAYLRSPPAPRGLSRSQTVGSCSPRFSTKPTGPETTSRPMTEEESGRSGLRSDLGVASLGSLDTSDVSKR